MTDVGHGMTVDGTISARQATKAGECVVLGDDKFIPATMLKLGDGLAISEDGTIYVVQKVDPGTYYFSQVDADFLKKALKPGDEVTVVRAYSDYTDLENAQGEVVSEWYVGGYADYPGIDVEWSAGDFSAEYDSFSIAGKTAPIRITPSGKACIFSDALGYAESHLMDLTRSSGNRFAHH